MKEDIDVIIEEKWRKQDKFATFISAIDKLTSPKYIKVAPYQGNKSVNVYKTSLTITMHAG